MLVLFDRRRKTRFGVRVMVIFGIATLLAMIASWKIVEFYYRRLAPQRG